MLVDDKTYLAYFCITSFNDSKALRAGTHEINSNFHVQLDPCFISFNVSKRVSVQGNIWCAKTSQSEILAEFRRLCKETKEMQHQNIHVCQGKSIKRETTRKKGLNPLAIEPRPHLSSVFLGCIGAYTLAPCLRNCFRMSTRNGKGAYAGVFLD